VLGEELVGDYDEGFYALFGFCALELGCVLCGYGWWIGRGLEIVPW
jgi:hypothetical protein